MRRVNLQPAPRFNGYAYSVASSSKPWDARTSTLASHRRLERAHRKPALALSIFGIGDLLTPFEQETCRIADPGCTAAAVFLVDGFGINGIAGLLERMLALLGAAMIVVLAVAVIRFAGAQKAA